MKGNFAEGGAGGSFHDVIRDTLKGDVRWRVRFRHYTLKRHPYDGSFEVMWVIDPGFTEARLLVKTHGKWGRWLVSPWDDDMQRAREAILLGGLDDGQAAHHS